MALDIRLVPCLSDNYGFVVRDEATGQVASVDTPDAQAIGAVLRALGWDRLDLILNTHWHPDHTGGNQPLKQDWGCRILGPAEVARVAPLDQVVAGGEAVELGQTRFKVLETPGHTLGHIAYVAQSEPVAFVGDVIFVMGCGRLFEGTPQQMWASLAELAALPDQTRLYCAHEYSEANARFALSVDDDPAVRARAEAVFEARRQGQATVPTTVAEEKATNPFLRAPQLRPGLDAVQAFAELRSAKDGFRG